MNIFLAILIGYVVFTVLLTLAGWRAYRIRALAPGEVLPDASTDVEAIDIVPPTWTRPEDYLRKNMITDEYN